MRRAIRWVVWTAAALVVLAVLAVPLLWGALNTDPGRRVAEWAVERLTKGQVALSGVTGHFPDALRVARLEIRDPHGTYLTADNVALDLEAGTLLSGQARVTLLAATDIVLARTPHYGDTPDSSPDLPVRFLFDRVVIDRLHIASAVAGLAAEMAVTGSGTLESRVAGTATLVLHRLDGGGDYRIQARVDDDSINAKLAADEPPHGLVAALAGLPELHALSLTASVDGPWRGMATKVAVSADGLNASAQGSLDIIGDAADLDVAATAPAMAPRDDLSWQSASLEGHVHGPWQRPRAQGRLAMTGVASGGALVRDLAATVDGDLGAVSLSATATDVRLPGRAPDLLAAAPVALRADARLDDPARPVNFTLTHPLISATGTLRTAGAFGGSAEIDLHDLTKLAALGVTPPKGLLGPDAHLSVAAALHGETVAVSRFRMDSGSLSVSAQGDVSEAALDVTWQGSMSDISAVAPAARGAVVASGHLQGPPDAPSGTVTADGTLEGAPVQLDMTVDRHSDGGISVSIARAEWKSAHAEGALTLSAAADLPAGRIAVRMDRLDDLSRLLGQRLAGAVNGEVVVDGPDVRVKATGTRVAVGTVAGVASAALTLGIRNAMTSPTVAGSLDLAGLSASGVTGTARLEANGSAAALAVTLRTTLAGFGDGPVSATAAGKIDLPGSAATLSALQATWHGETLGLLAPTRITYADGIRVSRTRVGLGPGVVEVAGRVSPTLDVTASVHALPIATLAPLFGPAPIEGTVQADATLTGDPARPSGRLHVSASGLRLRDSATSALPPATVTADATLSGGLARVTARAAAGTANAVTLQGTAPLDTLGRLGLRAAGTFDLATLDPILAGEGERARGAVTFDAAITGTLAGPRVAGTLRMADGDFRDFAQGLAITGIDALVQADGDRLRIVRFTGRTEGAGSIAVGGTVGLGGTMPVDLTITGKNARPIATDLLTARLDLDLALRGDLRGALSVSGNLTVDRAEVNVPERLPEKVASLNVRRPGQAPPSAANRSARAIALDVTMVAPGQIFLRGRGLDVELEGRIAVAGTTGAPVPSGSFTLRQGIVSIAGSTLTFTSGEVGFDGKGGLDPTLNLVATSTNGSITATLTITGYASAPKVQLTSVPQLPPDEVMAQLLFHQSATSLSPVQIAQGALALGQFTGVGGGFDPVNSVRQRLGLDRLSVGSAGTGNGTTLEAGRYVAPRIYVGAKRNTGDNSTQATVEIDVARHLKLEATAGTGGNAAATGATSTAQPSGSSIGLNYQFDY